MLGVALEFKNKPDTTTPINATNLNNMQKLLVDLIYPVGTYYETSEINFNPNTAWGGTWILENDGTVLVSKSNVAGSKFNADIGTVVGSETHTLTVNEMPSHNHGILWGSTTGDYYARAIASNVNDTSSQITYDTEKESGGGQPHNNVQPSKIINRWHRTA